MDLKKNPFLLKKQDKLFKLYCNEKDPILKGTKHNNFKKARNSVISNRKRIQKEYYHFLKKYSTNVKKSRDRFKLIVTLKSDSHLPFFKFA